VTRRVRLIDFGLSTIWREGDPPLRKRMGSLAYMAPEMLRRPKNGKPCGGYTRAVDVWALGVVTHAMLAGKLPFRASSDSALERLLASEGGPRLPAPDELLLLPPLPGGKADAASGRQPEEENGPRDLVMQMLTADPAQRVAAEAARAHAWLKQEPPRP